MRPGQKNRMRGGRPTNPGRRGPNPLTRSYESNGPDMKVRGTPQHIAEKYVQLARDAHSSGDTVMAESYLQHAEHYYRIIAAAQNVQQAAYNQANGLPSPASDDTMDDEDEFEVAGADRFSFRAPQTFQQPQPGGGGNPQNGYGPQQGFQQGHQQPYGDVPGAGDQPPLGGSDGSSGEGQPYQPRPPRPERPFDNRRPFENRGERPVGDRSNGDRPNGDRQGREGQGREGQGRDGNGRRFGRDRNFGDRPFNDRPYDRANGEPRTTESRAPQEPHRVETVAPAFADEQPSLPSFITAPVRPIGDEPGGLAPDVEAAGEVGKLRTRRRRRPRGEIAPGAAEAPESGPDGESI